MLEALEVSPEDSANAIEVIESNLAWQSSDAANEIYQRFPEDETTVPPPSEPPLTTVPTSIPPTTGPTTTPSLTTETSTLAADNLTLSISLGIVCAFMRLLL